MTILRLRPPFVLLVLLSLTLALGCISVTPRQKSPQATPIKLLQQRIDKLIEETDLNAHVGVHVVSLSSGKPVYSHNAVQLFTPASTLKIITAAAALHYLGPSYRFVTKLLTDAKRSRRGQLNALYLVGGGDPTLRHGDMADMADRLKQLGVRTIRGDIVVDDSLFDNVLWGNGWTWDDRAVAYSAPIEAAGCDHNRLLVHLLPGDRVGDPAHVFLSPNTTFVKIQNRVTTGRSGRSALSIDVLDSKQPQQRDGKQGLRFGETITLRGTVPLGSAARTLKFAVRQPSLFAGTLLLEQLKLRGITVKGRVHRGKVSAQGTKKQLVAHHSISLRELLVDMLRTSDNHATETLIKTIGLHVRKAPGSFIAGRQAVMGFMRQHAGVSTRTLLLADGSGLSRYSLMSPRQMTSVLRFMWSSVALRPDFVGSLPQLATYSNHLAKGLDQHAIVRHARVKTGTLTGVRNLAGYLVTTHGDPLAFTIFINGFVGSGAPYRQLQQRILQALADLPKQK